MAGLAILVSGKVDFKIMSSRETYHNDKMVSS